MADTYQTFHIGVNVFLIRNGGLLLGKRKNVYGAGTWGLPGGHLETGETMVGAAKRELMEETGLQANSYIFSNFVNDISSGQHYIQVGFVVTDFSGEPVIKEPKRCAEWHWFKLTDLPKELFPPHIRQIENFQQQSNFADITE
jgi:8-oxo-dGTP diphosphatase